MDQPLTVNKLKLLYAYIGIGYSFYKVEHTYVFIYGSIYTHIYRAAAYNKLLGNRVDSVTFRESYSPCGFRFLERKKRTEWLVSACLQGSRKPENTIFSTKCSTVKGQASLMLSLWSAMGGLNVEAGSPSKWWFLDVVKTLMCFRSWVARRIITRPQNLLSSRVMLTNTSKYPVNTS